MDAVVSGADLKRADGTRGAPAFVVHAGRVYDVTGGHEWRGGSHREIHWAGQDLTVFMDEAPHGPEVLGRFPIVGRLTDGH